MVSASPVTNRAVLALAGTRPRRANLDIQRGSARARALLAARAMRASFLLLIAVVVAQLGCGGRVDGVPSGGTTSPPGSSTEPPLGAGGGGSSTGSGASKATTPAPTQPCDLACDEGHEIAQGELPCAPGYACYTRSACGKSIACTGPAGLCEDPGCLGITQEVKACASGATCEIQRFCNVTLICEKTDAQCDGLPACDEGDQEVASATACVKGGGAGCYSRTECGGRIYCVENQ
jgi:hypothetical protein